MKVRYPTKVGRQRNRDRQSCTCTQCTYRPDNKRRDGARVADEAIKEHDKPDQGEIQDALQDLEDITEVRRIMNDPNEEWIDFRECCGTMGLNLQDWSGAMPVTKELKSLEEHNAERREGIRYDEVNGYPWQPSGLACPRCGKELSEDRMHVLTSIPPQSAVRCDCGYYGYKVR